jgi:hypothetical protein
MWEGLGYMLGCELADYAACPEREREFMWGAFLSSAELAE